MKKKFATFFLTIFAILVLFGCSGTSFSDIEIVATDVENVKEGEYYLPYTIEDYDKYDDLFSLDLQVTVYDEGGKSVPVENNRTINVKADKTYTVTVFLSASVNGELQKKSKTFTVVAVKSPRNVKFYTGSVLYKHLKIAYGETVDLKDYAEIPDVYTLSGSGVIQTIKSKKWTVYVDGEWVDLTQSHLDDITSDLIIRAYYDYSVTYKDITVKFENGDGTRTPSITQTAGNVIPRPEFPTREGYIFDGWYRDSELRNRFSWAESSTISECSDITLYAKWIENDTEEYEQYFEYELAYDETLYPYYKVFLKNGDYPSEIFVPVGRGNIPVKGFFCDYRFSPNKTYGAFEGTEITSVTLPADFVFTDINAFKDCARLTSVTFRGTKTEIFGSGMFWNCTALEEIALPEGLTTAGSDVFHGCTALKKVLLPSTLIRIETFSFENCTALRSIDLPDSLVSVRLAFNGCTSLEEVNIGVDSKLEFIATGAFKGCTSLKEITLPYVFSTLPNAADIFEDLSVKINYHPKPSEEN